MNDKDDILATYEGNVVELAEEMEENVDGFDEGHDEDEDDDDGVIQDDWHEATVVECEAPQGTRSSIGEEEGLRLVREEVELRLVREEVKRARPNNYAPGQRRTGGRCYRLVIQDDENTDNEQNTGQGGKEHGKFQSLGDYGLVHRIVFLLGEDVLLLPYRFHRTS
ncbi:hypothetical protein AMTR_s00060p00182100 [Amborella trichopoda]|uniref:Uncharacterized protein n=1 Tax=Amborella trichopoda TaxID=13333 RepID=W1NKC4_AMBTC|nr:hypothetical protein AMTR_s00060p00182100 [Amborella trichopoda]